MQRKSFFFLPFTSLFEYCYWFLYQRRQMKRPMSTPHNLNNNNNYYNFILYFILYRRASLSMLSYYTKATTEYMYIYIHYDFSIQSQFFIFSCTF